MLIFLLFSNFTTDFKEEECDVLVYLYIYFLPLAIISIYIINQMHIIHSTKKTHIEEEGPNTHTCSDEKDERGGKELYAFYHFNQTYHLYKII